MQTILIVDDEPNIVEGLASQLQQNYGDRAIVLPAYSGTHALSILRENQVDVVLLRHLHAGPGRPVPDGRRRRASGPGRISFFSAALTTSSTSTAPPSRPSIRGYLLKMEGDEVVLQKVDPGDPASVRRKPGGAGAGGSAPAGGAHAGVFAARGPGKRAAGRQRLGTHGRPVPQRLFGLETSAPVILILGKVRQRTVSDTLDMLVKIDRLLALRLTRFRFVSLLPEEGAPCG